MTPKTTDRIQGKSLGQASQGNYINIYLLRSTELETFGDKKNLSLKCLLTSHTN